MREPDRRSPARILLTCRRGSCPSLRFSQQLRRLLDHRNPLLPFWHRILRPRRYLVVSPTLQCPARRLLVPAAPLLEEERHLRPATLISNRDHPLLGHRSRSCSA